jgi:hypothetical protein
MDQKNESVLTLAPPTTSPTLNKILCHLDERANINDNILNAEAMSILLSSLLSLIEVSRSLERSSHFLNGLIYVFFNSRR